MLKTEQNYNLEAQLWRIVWENTLHIQNKHWFSCCTLMVL